MNQWNMKHRRRKHRRNQYLLFTEILLLAVVSVSGLLWYGFGGTAKKGHVMEEAPFTITQNEPEAEEEIKKRETSTGDRQQEMEGNQSDIQNAGTGWYRFHQRTS